METFVRLLAETRFRQQKLPFVRTLEDLDLVRLIGAYQALGQPLTPKLLLLEGLGSFATVQRRLMRLKRLGIVISSRAVDDKRTHLLRLSPTICKTYAQLGRLMGRFWCKEKASGNAARFEKRHRVHDG